LSLDNIDALAHGQAWRAAFERPQEVEPVICFDARALIMSESIIDQWTLLKL